MNVSQGEDIYQRLMDREEKKHLKRIQGKIPQMRDNQIYGCLPYNVSRPNCDKSDKG